MRRDAPPPNFRDQILGLISLGVAVFATWVFVETFSWVLPQMLHPVRLFDFPPGEQNVFWLLPCTVSFFCGVLSRRTIWGKSGVALAVLVILGITLMAHWGLQQIGGE